MHNQTPHKAVVQQLINSPHVTPQTAAVLRDRLHTNERIQETFFNDTDFRLLDAVSNCLYPQYEGGERIPLAEMLEKAIATGKGKGWRYNELPPLKVLFPQALQAINDEAMVVFETPFVALTVTRQEEVLQAIQDGITKSARWQQLSPQLFFTELLAMAAEQYYSHPLVKYRIGDASFADQPGWYHLGLNQWDGREPQP